MQESPIPLNSLQKPNINPQKSNKNPKKLQNHHRYHNHIQNTVKLWPENITKNYSNNTRWLISHTTKPDK